MNQWHFTEEGFCSQMLYSVWFGRGQWGRKGDIHNTLNTKEFFKNSRDKKMFRGCLRLMLEGEVWPQKYKKTFCSDASPLYIDYSGGYRTIDIFLN